jgi:hypothetical protein
LKNLGFLLREKLATVHIIPSSWGSQLDGVLYHQHRAASSSFLALLPGTKKEDFCKGSFARTSFTLF